MEECVVTLSDIFPLNLKRWTCSTFLLRSESVWKMDKKRHHYAIYRKTWFLRTWAPPLQSDRKSCGQWNFRPPQIHQSNVRRRSGTRLPCERPYAKKVNKYEKNEQHGWWIRSCYLLFVGHIIRWHSSLRHCMISWCKIEHFHLRFGLWANGHGRKWNLPHRRWFLRKTHNHWTLVPFGIDIMD